jgi:hypothetical protein
VPLGKWAKREAGHESKLAHVDVVCTGRASTTRVVRHRACMPRTNMSRCCTSPRPGLLRLPFGWLRSAQDKNRSAMWAVANHGSWGSVQSTAEQLFYMMPDRPGARRPMLSCCVHAHVPPFHTPGFLRPGGAAEHQALWRILFLGRSSSLMSDHQIHSRRESAFSPKVPTNYGPVFRLPSFFPQSSMRLITYALVPGLASAYIAPSIPISRTLRGWETIAMVSPRDSVSRITGMA